jgi:A/G-specific adenine glycosylase
MTRQSITAEGTERAETSPALGIKLRFSVPGFRNRLHAWYREHARMLPWRGVKDPYATWLSEIMLQQTRVATVRERYQDFLERFPTLRDLAEADENEVLALWSGLGYYRRARLLHRGAQFVTRELKGKLPRTAIQLRTLPGVGDYTAAAIASIAFGESIAVVDGNVERVLLRVLGMPEEKSGAARAELARVAQTLVPPAVRRPSASRHAISPGDHNQAMMELGATVCLPKAPLCLQCPLVDLCKTRGEHLTLRREIRQSRNVAHLLALRKRGVITEILLERRPQTASQMPGMMELPPIPPESTGDREPVLRLRHSITNTNFYVQIFAESAPGIAPAPPAEHDPDDMLDVEETPPRKQVPGSRGASVRQLGETPQKGQSRSRYEQSLLEDEAVMVADSEGLRASKFSEFSLLAKLALTPRDLRWISSSELVNQPLTGLARKSLQRLGVMPVPKIKLD